MHSSNSAAVSRRAGSTTARFPCTHFGSMGFNHGALTGNWHAMMRTPRPSRLTVWATMTSMRPRPR